MEVSYQAFEKFLNSEQHLNVPIYQRKYSWEQKHCKKFLNDVIDIGKSEKDEDSHFMGSVVFQVYKKDIYELIIIDGQQRITSLSLLILALVKFLKNHPNVYLKFEEINEGEPDRLINRYLINPFVDNDKNKLVLTEKDNDTYKKIMDFVISDIPLDRSTEDSEILIKNFNFFLKGINENNVNLILKGFEKLFIVSLDLKNLDTPQEIFESMNSTGQDLKNSDLIRNFLLMNLKTERQNYIYNTYWKNIELTFERNNSSFDDFIHNYLIMKLPSKTINKSDVYENFKEFSKSEFDKVDDLVIDIKKYVSYFSKIELGNESNNKLNLAFKNLSKLSNTVIHPFLFKIYDDYMDGKISAEEFVQIVEYTESYLFRRYVLGLHTNVLRNIFKTMYNNLDKRNYVESYKYNLFNLVEDKYNKRMPTNDEFIEELSKINVLSLTKNKKYLFDRLEKFKNKAPVDIYSDDYQIEHIMPRTLSDDWKNDLGVDWKRIHKDYLDTIGNITIIECNPELSNHTYPYKKSKENKGYLYSSVKLNNYFINIDKWDEDEIIKRRNYLCEKAIKIWKFPDITDEILDKYNSFDDNDLQEDYKQMKLD